ncbi:DUF2577 domain-containing protein [Clostridium estertheticum]|uniref:DUF2577 family protein n=1 Tax=Clostridium estertheticum TaxID=238834 RepID=UPI001CF4C04E|nr:DUF2577 family protein [Clostridium estertheticum]MCB2309053.1 DUF2577 domain-containing protein [Clostridium estertheticum]MCB2346813.1 DUF2577 domain-containing protein [Clostridium estertheticum]MCB2351875.1 DUF2577 domain-containing protein [Clostridium estertheticum]WAG48403.1 DUF2577 domain-containing protein [Clostridium estertheticum]
MDYATAFASKIHSKTNISRIGNSLGIVLSLTPLKISISGGAVILNDLNCYMCNNLVESLTNNATLELKAYTVNASANVSGGGNISSLSVSDKNDYDAVITFKDILKIGDKVLVISDIDGQKFFIVDKVITNEVI